MITADDDNDGMRRKSISLSTLLVRKAKQENTQKEVSALVVRKS